MPAACPSRPLCLTSSHCLPSFPPYTTPPPHSPCTLAHPPLRSHLNLPAIVASDPEPVFPGLSPDDLLTIYFTRPTNRPDVSTRAALLTLLEFSPPDLASVVRGSWVIGVDPETPSAGPSERLLVTLSGVVSTNLTSTLISGVRVSLLPSGGLRDAASTCQNASIPNVGVTGTWGDASQPQFMSSIPAVALDYGGQVKRVPGVAVLLCVTCHFPGTAFTSLPVDHILQPAGC
jgi:hypothetical protein